MIFFVGVTTPPVFGATKADELQTEINKKNTSIAELEKEVKKYEQEIQKVSGEKKTLNNEIYRLNLNSKKLSSSILVTDNKIKSTTSEVKNLSSEIIDKEKSIEKNLEVLSKSLRLQNESESDSLVEIFLLNDNTSDLWDEIESLQKFQIMLSDNTQQLRNLKVDLEQNKIEAKKKEIELVTYRSDLSDQKKLIEINTKEKNQLLSVTQNKESNYKKILAEKQKLIDDFEKELNSLESQLKMVLDSSKLPETAKGVLSWPLDTVRITQFFGNTLFASQNAQIYNGNGHPGVDFGIPVGTKIRVADDGVIEGTGNTDTVPPKCYSYGKWILVRHSNGLSTLYAHLSMIKANSGDVVKRGDVIGYSGNTGYSTGPHLHFSVYATQGVKIEQFTKSINCKDKFIPIAPFNAYLNPMNYLPKY